MRIFCFIFSFCLLLLSWQPCQDLAAKNDFCPTAEARQIHLHDTPQSEETDDCSPFCFCSCCQISTVYVRLTSSPASKFTASTEKSGKISYQSDYFQLHSNSIWQPPKFNFTA